MMNPRILKQWFSIFSYLLVTVIIVHAGTIEGTVTDNDSGDPVSDLRIRIYDNQWNFLYSKSAWTDSNGHYISEELETGSYYVRAVSVYPQPWITEYWFDARDKETAIPVNVSAGEPIIGIDFTLDKGGYITGRVEDETGHPLVDIDMDVYTSQWSYTSVYTDRTEENGEYILGPLPIQSWYVRADPDPVHGVCQEYWPDAWYRSDAQVLIPAAGGEIPGVDFVLPPGSSISGTVVEKRNQQVKSGYDVIIYSPEGLEQPIHGVSTDANGQYTAYGLPAGGYKVFVNAPWGCGVRDTYYPAAVDIDSASTVMLATSFDLDGIDFMLPEGNFDINIELDMPRRWVDPGELFGLTLTIDNDGPELTGLPAFIILDIQGALYFWPSWSLWDDSQGTGLDFALLDLAEDDSEVVILPEFIWPELGYDMDDLAFMGAITNWSMTALASDMEIEEWSFDGSN